MYTPSGRVDGEAARSERRARLPETKPHVDRQTSTAQQRCILKPQAQTKHTLPGRHAPGSMEKIKPGIAAVSPAPQPNKRITAKCPCKSQGREKFKPWENEITVRTKSWQICHGKAGALEMPPPGGAAIFNRLSRNRARRKYQAWSLPMNSQGAFFARSPPRKRMP